MSKVDLADPALLEPGLGRRFFCSVEFDGMSMAQHISGEQVVLKLTALRMRVLLQFRLQELAELGEVIAARSTSQQRVGLYTFAYVGQESGQWLVLGDSLMVVLPDALLSLASIPPVPTTSPTPNLWS